MSDNNSWLYLDGREPELIRPLLDTIRDLPPATPEDKQRVARRFFEKLDAALSQRKEPPVEPSAPIAPIAPTATTASMATTAPIPTTVPSPTAAPIPTTVPSPTAAPIPTTVPSPTATPLAPPRRERPAPELSITAKSPQFDARAAAPAPPHEPIAPSLPVNAQMPRPPRRRAPEALTIRKLDQDIPAEFREQMARSPFKAPAAPGNALAQTMQSPVHDLRKGETLPNDDKSIEEAAPPLPFPGNTVGTGVVPFPRLSLEQYASLRVDLAASPDRSADILLSYHVMNEAARGALDEHWQTQLAQNPDERARFHQALASYTAWLHAKLA